MARIRTIKPEFWKHEGLCEQPEATHMLAAALINYSDDFGYFNANPGLIRGEIYPLREPSVSIPESLRRLQTMSYIRLGTADGRRYGQIINFDEHQRVSHPTASKISCLSIAWDVSGNIPEEFAKPPETFVPEQGTGNGKEQGKEHEGRAAIATAPCLQVVEKDFKLEPEMPASLRRIPDKKPKAPVIPEWVPQEQWIAFVDMRRKIKFPLTDHAIKLAIAELDRLRGLGHAPAAVLDNCILKNYRGIFPPAANTSSPNPTIAAVGVPANLEAVQAEEAEFVRKKREQANVH